MNDLKVLKIEKRFNSVKDLYRYLIGNVSLISELIKINIQKPIKAKPFCAVGKEKITERNILFFASESSFPDFLSELIVLAGVYNSDIIVCFLEKTGPAQLETLNWLHKISNEDTNFILITCYLGD